MSGMPQSLREPRIKIKNLGYPIETSEAVEKRKAILNGLTDCQRRDIAKYGLELLEKQRKALEELRRLEAELSELQLVCPHIKSHPLHVNCPHCGFDCGEE